jgi:hypothetical protein
MDCNSENEIEEFYNKYIFVSYYVTHIMLSQASSHTIMMSTQNENIASASSTSLQPEGSRNSAVSNSHIFSAQTSSATCLGVTGFHSCSRYKLS